MSRILIVDDQDVNRELMREILSMWGHEVIEASDGESALDRVADCQPDLVLLDIQMPILDGYGVMHRFRQTRHAAGLRFVALTAYAMHGDREKLLAAGFDGYLSKPIDPLKLNEEIQRFLS